MEFKEEGDCISLINIKSPVFWGLFDALLEAGNSTSIAAVKHKNHVNFVSLCKKEPKQLGNLNKFKSVLKTTITLFLNLQTFKYKVHSSIQNFKNSFFTEMLCSYGSSFTINCSRSVKTH